MTHEHWAFILAYTMDFSSVQILGKSICTGAVPIGQRTGPKAKGQWAYAVDVLRYLRVRIRTLYLVPSITYSLYRPRLVASR